MSIAIHDIAGETLKEVFLGDFIENFIYDMKEFKFHSLKATNSFVVSCKGHFSKCVYENVL